eukprot:scaffold3396_cov385-Prasinococcus_capsulatus_cf.AAC.8
MGSSEPLDTPKTVPAPPAKPAVATLRGGRRIAPWARADQQEPSQWKGPGTSGEGAPGLSVLTTNGDCKQHPPARDLGAPGLSVLTTNGDCKQHPPARDLGPSHRPLAGGHRREGEPAEF